MHEATTRKISELESRLQESERERHSDRQERDELLRQLQQESRSKDE